MAFLQVDSATGMNVRSRVSGAAPIALLRVCGLAEYLPKRSVSNEDLSILTGRPASWFHDRTGIETWRRAEAAEDAATMGIAAARMVADDCPDDFAEIDLVLGATYTPSDTVGTLAHRVQRAFRIRDAKAMQISSACCSFLNALEVAAAMAVAGLSRTALIIASEHNSGYSSDADEQAGHLWGDAAAAMLLTTSGSASVLYEVLDIENSWPWPHWSWSRGCLLCS